MYNALGFENARPVSEKYNAIASTTYLVYSTFIYSEMLFTLF